MKLIVGLGNVGERYRGTRHNVGFQVVEELARACRARWEFDMLPLAQHGRCRCGRATCRALLPQTMMNESGRAVRAAVTRWRCAPEEMLFVCDDVNLPLGTLRLRASGSDGGHHGLASCLETLQTEAVPRLRVGVGVTPLPKDLTEFVLSPFRADEHATMRHTLTRAVEVCQVWAQEGVEGAMTCMSRPSP